MQIQLLDLIKSDFAANSANPKGFALLFFYRLAHGYLNSPVLFKPFWAAYVLFYKFFIGFIFGVDLPWRVEIGSAAKIYHAFGLVIHSRSKIGSHVILCHSTTIGQREVAGELRFSTIGDYVDIGPGVMILGAKVGNHAVIGAGSVVIKDVPAYAVVAGNPARILKIKNP